MSRLAGITALRDLFTDAETRYVRRIGYPLSPALESPRRPLTDLVLDPGPPQPEMG
jgi:hypothetical protein